jgi:perosamine synthetase
MSNIQAAIGCGQLERFDELVSAKRRVFEAYRRGLAGLPVSMNPEPPGTVNGFWMPTVVCDHRTGVTREDLQRAFARRDIDARVFFHPLSSLPMFEDVSGNVHARDIPERAINLPSYAELSDEQIEAVLDVVRGLLA